MLRCTPARLLFAVATVVVAALPHVVGSASEASDFPLRGLEAGKLYAVTVSVDSLYRLSGAGEIEASISDGRGPVASKIEASIRSEEHTSELQSLTKLVCRLLLEKKNNRSLGEKRYGAENECGPMLALA